MLPFVIPSPVVSTTVVLDARAPHYAVLELAAGYAVPHHGEREAVPLYAAAG